MIIVCLSDNYFEICYGLEINCLDFIFKYSIGFILILKLVFIKKSLVLPSLLRVQTL